MSDPLVSVIIPTYNREDLILDTVKSILRQSYESIEVIVVSDGGTDNTGVLMEGVGDERLCFIRLPENSRLPAVTRNVGIKTAKGSFIAFCDDDDMWLEGKLESQVKEFQKSTFVECISANTFLYPDRKMNSFFLTKDKYVSYSFLLLNIGNIINTSTVLLKKEILDEVGLFDESPLIKGYEDIDLWLRILQQRDLSIKVLRKAWINYRVNNTKITYSNDFEVYNDIAAFKYIYQKHLPLSSCQLKLISDYDQYSKIHHVARTSMKLCYGVLSAKDVMNDNKMSLRSKAGIMIKYLIKRVYFYYFNLFDRRVHRK